jgi:hypothetical protein
MVLRFDCGTALLRAWRIDLLVWSCWPVFVCISDSEVEHVDS